MVAVAVLPVPSFEFTCTALTLMPGVTPFTLTETVQAGSAAIVAPVRATLPLPPSAVAGPARGEGSGFGGDPTGPAGNESVNATPVFEAAALRLVTVRVSVVFAPTGIVAAPK